MSWERIVARAHGLVGLAPYALLLVALLAIEPAFSSPYLIRLANATLIEALAALAVNVVMGFAGLVSIAHAALMATGAYLSALLMLKLGVPFIVAFAAACAVCGVISAAVGFLGNRVETNYLLVITLGIHQAILLVIVNETWLTGGASGLFNVPAAAIGPWTFDSDARYYVLVAPVFVLGLYLVQRLRASKAGRAMIAIRLHPPAAAMSGIDVNKYRIWAMAFAGVYFGAAGSLFAHMIRFLAPDDFSMSLALSLILVAVVGGLSSNIGICVSAVALTVATQEFQGAATSWVLYYGILIMVVMVVAPRGLAGLGEAIFSRAKLRARGVRTAPAPPGGA